MLFKQAPAACHVDEYRLYTYKCKLDKYEEAKNTSR